MGRRALIFIVLAISLSSAYSLPNKNHYNGKYCSGSGDADFLRLIDESFAFFYPNPTVPNLTMVYKPEWDTFNEGANWGAWWMQNSYGFAYSVTPYLEEPWFSLLQRSLDLFWDNQGDGIRKGKWGGAKQPILSQLVGPDGSLGGAAAPGQIVFRQGDGDVKIHDWFYEVTPAGVVMQSEILLLTRDLKAISYYLPKMARACDYIEKTRDPKNNLFLTGPASNLLGPSYGGVRQSDGTFGKGYLAGISITYLAALNRMIELYKILGDRDKLAEYEHRQKITRESLPQLMTPAGYFIKSLDPDGTKHGVPGQEKFGYLEGVDNADAVALRVVDDQTAENIYKQIAAFPDIRPFDFLLTNAPGLDDTYKSWGSASGPGLTGFWKFGDWVNGGAWGTSEGRAILMYYRLGKFEDIRRSAIRAMKWAKDFRMDAPWSQRGENTHNPWSDSGRFRVGGVAVMIDNFAIPAATIRGLFDFEYRSDCLILRPRVPGTITQYIQKPPIHFGGKNIFLSCLNGGPKVRSVKINHKAMKLTSTDEITLWYHELPATAKIEIVTKGGWPKEAATATYPVTPSLIMGKGSKAPTRMALPVSLRKPFAVLSAMKKKLKNKPEAKYEKAFVTMAIQSIEACQVRLTMDPGPGYYRAVTPERREGINKFYEQSALSMYNGFALRMAGFAEKGDSKQKQLAALFFESKQ